MVSDSTLSDNGALGVTPEDLKRHLVEAFDATGHFQPLPPDEEAKNEVKKEAPLSYRVRIELGFTRESDELTDGGAPLRQAEVGLTLTLTPASLDGEGDQLRSESSASRLFDPGAPGPGGGPAAEKVRTLAFQGALDAALRHAAGELLLQVDAARKTDPELIADLDSGDAGMRDSALRQLAERRNAAAVPALIAHLKDPDREVVLRTMGALEGIRDQRAVRPLIDLTDRQDPAFVAQVVYVIGSLGGPDAEAFLFTLQTGSLDPQVRVAATEAAAELRRRRDHSAAEARSATAPSRESQ